MTGYAAAGSSLLALTAAAVDAAAPCVGGDPVWTSPGTSVEVREAIRRCRSCPVVELCRDAAGQVRPRSGIWGGRKYGDPPRGR